MKRIFAILSLLLLYQAVFSAAPYNASIGMIATDIPDDGIAARALEAAKDVISVEWFERYTTNEKILMETFYIPLSEILPLGNPVCSVEKNGAVSLLDLAGGTIISFTFSGDLISAIKLSS